MKSIVAIGLDGVCENGDTSKPGVGEQAVEKKGGDFGVQGGSPGMMRAEQKLRTAGLWGRYC
jgi:hypothetical protein